MFPVRESIIYCADEIENYLKNLVPNTYYLLDFFYRNNDKAVGEYF